jgi:ketosteroid isomerase-like protein
MRGFVRAFCDALTSCDPEKIAPYLADDVEWMGFGPLEIFPFFGHRRGKQDVMKMCGEIADSLALRRCNEDSMLVDGNNVASLSRITAVHVRSGRVMIFRLAHFAEFRDRRLVSLKAVFDSFDAVEQALGRPLDLSAVA